MSHFDYDYDKLVIFDSTKALAPCVTKSSVTVQSDIRIIVDVIGDDADDRWSQCCWRLTNSANHLKNCSDADEMGVIQMKSLISST